MESEIEKAVEEFSPLYDEVTTSDLQGLCMARAMQILRAHGHADDVISVMNLSDKILEAIYEKEEKP